MDRLTKFFDQNITDKVISTVSNIKRDFTRRSKRRKAEKKEKKLKKIQQINSKKNQLTDQDDVEHKYKLCCDIIDCEYHPKPNAYEDFLNTYVLKSSNRASISTYGSQIIGSDEDKKSNKSNSSLENRENFILNENKLSRFSDHQSSDDSSSDSMDNLVDILNKDAVKLTITNENGETTTVIGIDGLNNSDLPIQSCGKCMICFNKLKSPLFILPCYHLFHESCISQWLDIKTRCPLCNQQINDEQIEKYKKSWS